MIDVIKFSVFVLVSSFVQTLNAQTSVGDCIGAIPVCQSIYVEEFSPIGTGNIDPEIDKDLSCLFAERNSAWYIFTILEGGELGFTITPQNLDDDYDWCLFNITDKTCNDIHSDIEFISSCNATGGVSSGVSCHGITGADGSTPYPFQNPGCGIDPPAALGFSPFNALIPVNQGESYVLLLDNWSGSEFGYTLAFDKGDAVIVDTTELKVIESIQVGDLTCSWDGAILAFSERIDCSQSTSEGILIIDEKGDEIDAGIILNCPDPILGFTNQLELIFTKPIRKAGSYTLIVENAIADLCRNLNSKFEITIELEIIEPKVFIPNAFTPNNDGLNDQLILYPNDKIQEITLFEIYDRWGNLVFKSNPSIDEIIQWNGRMNNKDLNSGTYMYIIEYTTTFDEKINKYGSINILK